MKKLFAVFLLTNMLVSCRKEEPIDDSPKTLADAGYVNEIDVYRPGSYWIYRWQEFDITGNEIANGTDSITVADEGLNEQRTLTGTVNGRSYTEVYHITNDSIFFWGKSGDYVLYGPTRILFNTAQIIEDQLLDSDERGCVMNIYYTYRPNISVQTDAGVFATAEAKQNTLIGNASGGGCTSGYEIINYIPRLGEAYRETSWINDYNDNYKIRFKRLLVSYHIAD